jgi:hypothetical protein
VFLVLLVFVRLRGHGQGGISEGVRERIVLCRHTFFCLLAAGEIGREIFHF